MSSRLTREQMLMGMATVVSYRATCSRKQVGCVIALEGRVLSTGYNGAPAGQPHCRHESGNYSHAAQIADEGHPNSQPAAQGCKVSVHAEANAIAFAAKHGVAIDGADLYTTMAPCLPCAQLIVNCGIKVVVCGSEHHRPMEREGIGLLERAGIMVAIAVPTPVG